MPACVKCVYSLQACAKVVPGLYTFPRLLPFILNGMAGQERGIDKVPDLTAQERETLMSVMQRAKVSAE